MRISNAFPSRYLRAGDIPSNRFLSVQIDHVAKENVAGTDDPQEEKPVLYFVGKAKGMVLNRTNAQAIAEAYGDETDHWRGRTMLLYSTETLFQGRMVPCLRLKPPARNAAASSPPAARPPAPPAPVDRLEQESELPMPPDDDVPF